MLGGSQGVANLGYQAPEIRQRLLQLAPCNEGETLYPDGTCGLTAAGRASDNAAKIQLARELARDLDSEPWAGDFNISAVTSKTVASWRPGRTTGDLRVSSAPSWTRTGTQLSREGARKPREGRLNDTWGAYLKGEISAAGLDMQLTSITGYDTYDRLIDIDLDFSPETLFQIRTDDEGWQVSQRSPARGASFGDESPLRWDIGGWFLREQLDVVVTNDLGKAFCISGSGRATTPRISGARRATRAWPSTSGTTSPSTAASATTGSRRSSTIALDVGCSHRTEPNTPSRSWTRPGRPRRAPFV